jgi:hypothetical protein
MLGSVSRPELFVPREGPILPCGRLQGRSGTPYNPSRAGLGALRGVQSVRLVRLVRLGVVSGFLRIVLKPLHLILLGARQFRGVAGKATPVQRKESRETARVSPTLSRGKPREASRERTAQPGKQPGTASGVLPEALERKPRKAAHEKPVVSGGA